MKFEIAMKSLFDGIVEAANCTLYQSEERLANNETAARALSAAKPGTINGEFEAAIPSIAEISVPAPAGIARLTLEDVPVVEDVRTKLVPFHAIVPPVKTALIAVATAFKFVTTGEVKFTPDRKSVV